MVIPNDVLLQARLGTAAVDDVRAAGLVAAVFLFLALLAAFAAPPRRSAWADAALLFCAVFAFGIWWPLAEHAALPAHFV